MSGISASSLNPQSREITDHKKRTDTTSCANSEIPNDARNVTSFELSLYHKQSWRGEAIAQQRSSMCNSWGAIFYAITITIARQFLFINPSSSEIQHSKAFHYHLDHFERASGICLQ